MGMSASQARLLSITARLTNNELESQFIANSKLRLATETEAVTQKYMNALDSKKLVYGNYNDNGDKVYTDLTPALMLTYADMKNQYALVNNKNQIMVMGKDASNYVSSDNMADFMYKYGIEKVDNPEYIRDLTTIFGDDYESFMAGYTSGSAQSFISSYISGLVTGANSWLGSINGNTTNNSTSYNNWRASSPITGGMFTAGNLSGLLGSYYSALQNPPVWDFGDRPAAPTLPDFAALAGTYRSSRCYSDVGGTDSPGIWHLEHNLCALIWGENGLGVNTSTNTVEPISNSSGTITITKNGYNTSNVSLTNTNVDSNSTTVALITALKNYSRYNCVQNVIQNLKDLYCDSINYLNTNYLSGMTASKYTITSSATTDTTTNLYNRWVQFYNDLDNLQINIQTEMENDYNNELGRWNAIYNSFINNFQNWQNNANNLQQLLLDRIENLADEKIPDENDAKYQWYKNLYFRMGGGSRNADDTINTYNYKVIEENLLHSSEWLDFALSQGILTLEQAQFSKNGSEVYVGMGTYDWVSIPYTNATDLTYVDDEQAITIAEVEYKKSVNSIQCKDKEYDQKLKKLDTEHSALQTEFDALKDVIGKNVDRSFKAFS